MSLTVRRISRDEHTAFADSLRDVSFLQTPAWGAVKSEWRAESLGWFDHGQLVGVGLVLHRPVPKLKRATLAYLAEGPLIDWAGILDCWLRPLAAHLKANGAFAIRLGPPVRTHTWSASSLKTGLADAAVNRITVLPSSDEDVVGMRASRWLLNTGWLPQNTDEGFGMGHPQFKFEVPLRHADGRAKTETEVLEAMNQQWRRNIKKSAKERVEVTVGEDLDEFHELYLHTAQRDGFTPRPLSYFQRLFATMNANEINQVKLYLAHHDNSLAAAAILITVGGRACYTYGASSTAKREVRGSNAVQWAMICDSLNTGCDVYDLRGITPTLDADDPHVGLIQFKVGTGGQAVRYVGEWDLPLRPLIYRGFSLYLKRRESSRRNGR